MFLEWQYLLFKNLVFFWKLLNEFTITIMCHFFEFLPDSILSSCRPPVKIAINTEV